jgi:hypothetical protein
VQILMYSVRTSQVEKNVPLYLVLFLIIPVEWEHVVADSGCVEIVPDPEVETKCSLHRRLPAGNGQAKRSREVVDNVFERVQVRDRGKEVWAMQELGDRKS